MPILAARHFTRLGRGEKSNHDAISVCSGLSVCVFRGHTLRAQQPARPAGDSLPIEAIVEKLWRWGYYDAKAPPVATDQVRRYRGNPDIACGNPRGAMKAPACGLTGSNRRGWIFTNM